jgi:hypothetical protein
LFLVFLEECKILQYTNLHNYFPHNPTLNISTN